MYLSFSKTIAKFGKFRLRAGVRVTKKNAAAMAAIAFLYYCVKLTWYMCIFCGWLIYVCCYGMIYCTKKMFGGIFRLGKSVSNPISHKDKSTMNDTAPSVHETRLNTRENSAAHTTADIKEEKSCNQLETDELNKIIEKGNQLLKKYRSAWLVIIISVLIGIYFPPLFVLTIAFLIRIGNLKKEAIDLDVLISADMLKDANKEMEPMKKIAQSEKVWYITSESRVVDRKYSGGAGKSIDRTECAFIDKLPFPFKSNYEIICLKKGKETLIFYPTAFFMISGDKIVGMSYSDMKIEMDGTRFIEKEKVPSDAKIVGETWKYINKTGGPDKRFKDNVKYPICLYGELKISTINSGINTVLMFSNTDVSA